MRMRTWAIVVLGVLAACGEPKQQGAVTAGQRLSGERVSVMEFGTEGARVHYTEPYDTFGLMLASEIAADLLNRRHLADVVRAGGTPASGTVVVRGRVFLIDAG